MKLVQAVVSVVLHFLHMQPVLVNFVHKYVGETYESIYMTQLSIKTKWKIIQTQLENASHILDIACGHLTHNAP